MSILANNSFARKETNPAPRVERKVHRLSEEQYQAIDTRYSIRTSAEKRGRDAINRAYPGIEDELLREQASAVGGSAAVERVYDESQSMQPETVAASSAAEISTLEPKKPVVENQQRQGDADQAILAAEARDRLKNLWNEEAA